MSNNRLTKAEKAKATLVVGGIIFVVLFLLDSYMIALASASGWFLAMYVIASLLLHSRMYASVKYLWIRNHYGKLERTE